MSRRRSGLTANNVIVRGKLRHTRGVLKEKWARLTHNERGMIDAKIDQALGLLQENYGYSLDKAWQVLQESVLSHDGLGSSLFEKTNQQIRGLTGKPKKKARMGIPLWFWLMVGTAAVIMAIRFIGDESDSGGLENSSQERSSLQTGAS